MGRTTMTSPDYLAQMADAGLVDEVDGVPYVSGVTIDPLTDEKVLFVEYADPRLLRPASWPRFVEALGDQAPKAVIRKPADVPFPPGTGHHTHYLLAVEPPARTTEPVPDLEIRSPHDDSERERVYAWLAKAMVYGYGQRGTEISTAAAVDMARARFADDDVHPK